REAPVLILKYDATVMVGGGAANAANNVAVLGGGARLLGVVGRDPEGRRLIASLQRGVHRRQVMSDANYRTPVKTRILAGGPIPVLLDSRYRLTEYRSLTACTPNESEVEHIVGAPIKDDAAALERAGRMLLKKTRMGAVLVTRGSRGMALFEPGRRTVHVPIF